MTAFRSDALVLGGGPAGAAAAMVLADAGRRVTLVRPITPPGASLGQSIPPSARSLLEELGFAQAMDGAAFVPNLGNTVAWADTPTRREAFADDTRGYHADRGSLEAVLDGVLRAAGVEVRAGLHARTAERSSDGWRIGCQGAGEGASTFEAPWVVDATGRHGFLARRLGRTPDRRTSTLALVGRWRVRERENDPDEGHTVIGSHPGGWAWSVPVSPTSRCVTAMVDPRHAPLGSTDLLDRLQNELRQVPVLQSMLAEATHVGGTVWACPASLYTSRRHADHGVLLAGDAGSFIDPLSSYGVKKALISGRLAGIVAASCLNDPRLSEHGTTFFDAHERNVAADYRARAADFFESAAEAYREPFWTDRLAAAVSARAEAPASGLGEVHVERHAVVAAHEELRARSRLELVHGPTTRVVQRPGLRDRELILDDHLVSDVHPEPVRYFRSVDLRVLTRIAVGMDGVPELWSGYNRAAPPVDLPEFVTALAVACAAGFLVLDPS
jgi:flavin-dependent dehydrogenase